MNNMYKKLNDIVEKESKGTVNKVDKTKVRESKKASELGLTEIKKPIHLKEKKKELLQEKVELLNKKKNSKRRGL